MNAALLGLACLAALNPKLLVVELILVTNQRPRLMFVFLLVGGMSVAITVGLLDVLALHPTRSTRTTTPVAGSTWPWGYPADHRSRARDHRPAPPLLAAQSPPAGSPGRSCKGGKSGPYTKPWVDVLVGVVVDLPGTSYLTASHQLVAGTTAAMIAPGIRTVNFAFEVVHPRRTEQTIKRAKDWIMGHQRHAVPAVLAGP